MIYLGQVYISVDTTAAQAAMFYVFMLVCIIFTQRFFIPAAANKHDGQIIISIPLSVRTLRGLTRQRERHIKTSVQCDGQCEFRIGFAM